MQHINFNLQESQPVFYPAAWPQLLPLRRWWPNDNRLWCFPRETRFPTEWYPPAVAILLILHTLPLRPQPLPRPRIFATVEPRHPKGKENRQCVFDSAPLSVFIMVQFHAGLKMRQFLPLLHLHQQIRCHGNNRRRKRHLRQQ